MKPSAWFLLNFLILLAGCASGTTDGRSPSPVYLYPRLKYASKPHYSLTHAERTAAVREFHKIKAEILYEMVVDREGNVVRIRPTRAWDVPDGDYFTIGFMQRIQKRKLDPDDGKQPYRTCFYPVNVESSTEFFDW